MLILFNRRGDKRQLRCPLCQHGAAGQAQVPGEVPLVHLRLQGRLLFFIFLFGGHGWLPTIFIMLCTEQFCAQLETQCDSKMPSRLASSLTQRHENVSPKTRELVLITIAIF